MTAGGGAGGKKGTNNELRAAGGIQASGTFPGGDGGAEVTGLLSNNGDRGAFVQYLSVADPGAVTAGGVGGNGAGGSGAASWGDGGDGGFFSGLGSAGVEGGGGGGSGGLNTASRTGNAGGTGLIIVEY